MRISQCLYGTLMMEAILLNVQKTLHILILLHNLEPKLLHIVIFYYTRVL